MNYKKIAIACGILFFTLFMVTGCAELIEALNQFTKDVTTETESEPDPTPKPNPKPTPSPTPTPTITTSSWNVGDFSHVYEVGSGKPYSTPNDVPWESLQKNSLVRIHYRSAPYKCKWVINTAGTKSAPIVILGVPNSSGKRPVISGNGATTRSKLSYWNEDRSVLKIGGSNKPAGQTPSWVYIQGLEIISGRPAYSFKNSKGASKKYISNAASIHVENGKNIFIRDCILRDSGNGLFASPASENITVSGNNFYDNGIKGSIYQHNVYTECYGIIFEYNRLGTLRAGCEGNNLKDRSCGTVIRYNWIEDGNRQLDLVDAGSKKIRSSSSYLSTYVYGNVLIENPNQGNYQIVHYGGDSGKTENYRNGTLFFYNNTIVSNHAGYAVLVKLGSKSKAEIYNNIAYSIKGGKSIKILNKKGKVNLKGNCLPKGWNKFNTTSPTGTVNNLGNVEGTNPSFVNFSGKDFRLKSDSIAINRGVELPQGALSHPVLYQYVKHARVERRPSTGIMDIGAFEK